MNIAIIAVAYNRVDSLKRLLTSLENAYYDEEATLIISVDKSNTDIVEIFAENYIWTKGVKIVDKHDKNLGLRPHMMSLGKWFDKYDAIIVLEDDIIVSQNFYTYSKQTILKYHRCQNIAGISLYSFALNHYTKNPFTPLKKEYDTYFMNCAMSWGEIWMRDSWHAFYEWYKKNQEFPLIDHLPRSICLWDNKSWLKYHTRYCIENNKYFVHPYVSLTTNFDDDGIHTTNSNNAIHQVPIQHGKKDLFNLPCIEEDATIYDGFFENVSLYKHLGYAPDELCLDLQGEWHNRLNKRYWLTTDVVDYKIIRSFGLNYRPIEVNVLNNNAGNQIFLYDTTIVEKNPNKKNKKSMLYHYHLSNMFYFIREYGFCYAIKDFVEVVKRKIIG